MFFRKLLASYILIIIIPLVAIAVIVTNITTRTINEQVDASAIQALNQSSGSIGAMIDNARNTALSISMNKKLQNILKEDTDQSSVQIDKEVVTIRNDILYPGIFNHNYSSVEIYATKKASYPKTWRRNDVMYSAVVKDAVWYQSTLKLRGRFFYHISSEFDTPKLTISRAIMDVKDYTDPIAVISVNIDLEEINGILGGIQIGKTGRAYLADQHGRPVSAMDMQGLPKEGLKLDNPNQSQLIQRNGRKVFMRYRALPKTEWVIVELVPYSEITEKADLIKQIIYIIGLVSLVLSVLISLYFSLGISRPIIQLAKTMEKMEDGNFDVKVSTTGTGEIQILYRKFNYMIGTINELISKVYVSQIKEKDYELRALQAQINPHFLYNTLNSINWLAIKYKIPDISKLVISLSSILRYSLNKGQKLIDIGNELRQVESYINIEKAVHPGRFEVEFDIEPEILQHQTIKLVLQPLVENAVIHGLETYEGNGIIKIRGKKIEQGILFEVANNGNPVDLAKINGILQDPDSSETFGVSNVNTRLKLSYGEENGLRFEVVDGWTIARILIPIKNSEHQEGQAC